MKTVKIIGCGLSGITAAILLKEKGYSVKLFDKRSHIGGNCFDEKINNTNLHKYGPHLFHTNDEEVFNFLSKYTEWYTYHNRPKGVTDMGVISLPYSKKTVKELGRELTQEEITDLIFRGYSEKQWGVPFSEIPTSITGRVPKTKDCEDPTWYGEEKYQCLPKNGYTKMMEKMLEGFEVVLNCSNSDWKSYKTDLIVYTGKIDEYYAYKFGKLPYRSLDFDIKFEKARSKHAILNYTTKEKPYTRVVDYGHLTYNHSGEDSIRVVEYPKQCGENDIPFYPIPFGQGVDLYNKYKELADKEEGVIFLGRLATYKYLDMWMSIKQVMIKLKNID